MTLAKFISSITCRQSSGISTPVSSPLTISYTSRPSNGPFGEQFSSPKSPSSSKSPSPFQQSSKGSKSPVKWNRPSRRPGSSEQTSEIVEFSQQHKHKNESFFPLGISPKRNEQEYGMSSASAGVITSGLRQELERAFRQFDANSDGKISATELGAVLRSLGDDITDEEAIEVVKEVDADGDGYIDLQEFIDMNTRSVHSNGEIASLDELKAAFLIFDMDRNGLIAADELHRVLKNLGNKKCTVDDCSKMLRGVDRNGDGFVDFDEFKFMMLTTSY
eukprot:c28923_g1_i3 orf=461-1288(+)